MSKVCVSILSCFLVISIGCSTTPAFLGGPTIPKRLTPHPNELRVKSEVEGKIQDTTQSSRGYTKQEVAAFKPYMRSNCTWCADYEKKSRGFLSKDDPIGTVTRMCNPQWNKLCTKKAILGDGSLWGLIGNCKCDKQW